MFYRLGPDLWIRPTGSGPSGILMRIGDDARKCVVFFGVPDGGGGIAYGGTGFLVAFPTEDFADPFAYIVTARHVATALQKWDDTGFYLRANTNDGASTPVPLIVLEWHFHPDPTVDLAAFSAFFGPPNFDHRHYTIKPESYVDHTVPNMVVCGDDANLVGLFRLHAGSKRNVPIVHSGHIALLPDPDELIPIRDRSTNEIVESEVFLIEAQTLDGLSGSPVFLHEMLNLELWENIKPMPKAYGGVRLLGLYTGSWDGEPGKILEADRNLKGGTRVPVGMGTVVPATKIVELLRDHPKMKKDRQEYIAQKKGEKAAVTDSAIAVPLSTGANPKHREDFSDLLNKAATTKASDQK